jgi:hypothetical protein
MPSDGLAHLPVEKSYELVTTGTLSGWPALLAFVALGGLVCWQLQRELRRLKGLDRTAGLVMAVRLAIVGLAVWLLCQPLLLVTSRWQEPPEVILLAGRRSSMKVLEDFGHLYRKVDVLEMLEQRPIENRNRSFSQLEQRLAQLGGTLEGADARLHADRDDMSNGLPPKPGFERFLDALAEGLNREREAMVRLRSLIPATLGSEELDAERARFVNQLQVLTSSCQELAGEAAMARREAVAHPDLLEKLVARLGTARQAASSAVPLCRALQAGADASLLSKDVLAGYRERKCSRWELADMAASRISSALAGRARATLVECAALPDGLKHAIARQLSAPVAALIVLDDGSADISQADRELLSTLAETNVPLHTVLVGADGVEPKDLGLIAVDLPGIAVVGRKLDGRALVKAGVAEGDKAHFVVREAGKVVRQVEIKPGGKPVVEFSLIFDSPGRRQLVMTVEDGEGDAFPGNERAAVVVDVFRECPRVFILADGLSRDFVLYRSVAENLPFLLAEGLLTSPRLRAGQVGHEQGQLPANAEEWKSIGLLVLLGGGPEGFPQAALAELRKAVQEGLHVLVQADRGKDSWAAFLGLAGEAGGSPGRLTPRADLWLPFYALAQDHSGSLAVWKQLPAVAVVPPIRAGIPLVDGGPGAAIQAFLYDQRVVIYNGLPSLAALRHAGNAGAVNRLVAGLLDLGLTLRRETPDSPLLLPSQPVHGKSLIVAGLHGELKPGRGLELVETANETAVLRVVDDQEAAFEVGGHSFVRAIHKLLGPEDFRLTARAAVLRDLAQLGHGKYVDLLDLPDLLSELNVRPAARSKADAYRLWAGWWPLAAMLLLVSAEYLLRRKAGRVM